MIKFSICSEIFKDWDFKRICQYVSKTGYQGIEIAPFTLADSVLRLNSNKRKELKNAAKRYNLEIVGLHWLLVKPDGLYINSKDAVVRRKTKKYFFELVKFCADVGGRIMVIGSPKQRNIVSGMTYNEVWNITKDFLKNCAEFAKKEGIMLCLEPLSKEETNLFNTAEETIKFINEINNSNFQMLLDVKAMSGENKPIPEIIKSSKDYIKHFHANDVNKRGPGFGNTDFIPIAKALKYINYNGYVSVEVFDFAAGPETIAEKSLEYLRKVF